MKLTVKKSVVTKTSKPRPTTTGFPCPTMFPKC